MNPLLEIFECALQRNASYMYAWAVNKNEERNDIYVLIRQRANNSDIPAL